MDQLSRQITPIAVMNPLRCFVFVLLSLPLLAAPVRAAGTAAVEAVFATATTVPITAASYSATGNTVNLALNFEPPAGTNLTVVKNTGLAFIQGTFGNLAQGQRVSLTYGGVAYPFVANYYGGTGNDLVLHWANTWTLVWGSAFNTFPALPVAQPLTGALVGKTVLALAVGGIHCLALCHDGSVAAWGQNGDGELGNGTNVDSAIPVPVRTTGALAGKRVVAISAGRGHSMALCADGTVAVWGSNYNGQLGNGTYTASNVPILVPGTGALAGKKVVTISAGGSHCLVLCSDGTVVGWGNHAGNVPVAVVRTGVLAGKTVTAIAAGYDYSLAVCSDGTLAAWGDNSFGQLGNNSTTTSTSPVAVVRTGVLAGKTVTAIAAGGSFTLALCSDNSLVGWGSTDNGVLGPNVVNYKVPGTIAKIGALNGKIIRGIAAGSFSAYAWCTDGSLAAWGANYDGVLGDGTTIQSSTPVATKSTALRPGEQFTQVYAGSNATWATVSGPVSNDATLAGLTVSSGHLEPPTDPESGSYVARVITGTAAISLTPVAADPFATVTVSGAVVPAGAASSPVPLPTAAIIIRVTAPRGAVREYTVTVAGDPRLANLALNGWSLSPAFASGTLDYAACVSAATTAVTLTPTAVDGAATIMVNGTPISSGATSGQISLSPGITDLTVRGETPDGAAASYRIRVLRPEPLAVTFDSPETVGVRAAGYTATGNTVTPVLNFAPAAGAVLKVIDNTGMAFIRGTFANCAQGQLFTLGYQGVNYRFVANYFGGTGNDLVLQWADNRVFAWGPNSVGQLGDGLSSSRHSPFPVDATGVLAGRTLAAIDGNSSYSIALGVDGKLAAWGSSWSGELGSNLMSSSKVPVAVITTGVLAGKTVAAIASGGGGNLALCSDGTLVTWGNNNKGQLGNGGTDTAYAPVAVKRDGVIAGRDAVAIASGGSHCLALLADGTLVAWGFNASGQLGDGTQINRNAPVAVDQTGVLAGRTITAIAAGGSTSYALCADGAIAAWGTNSSGELGNLDWTLSTVPVLVRNTGVLAGKSVVSLITKFSAVYALCTDGSLVVWGSNAQGILGDGTTNNALLPIDITQQGVLAGRRIERIGACETAAFASCADGTFASWGNDGYGELGNGAKPASMVPDFADVAAMGPNNRITALAGGLVHGMALVATAPSNNSALAALTVTPGELLPVFAPGVTTLRAIVPPGTTSLQVTPTVADAKARVSINGSPATSGALSPPIPLDPAQRSVEITVTAEDGSTTEYTVAVEEDSSLSGLALSDGTLVPTFSRAVTNYEAYVSNATTSVALTPTAFASASTVTVNGAVVASGAASQPLPLVPGPNSIEVTVVAGDGSTTLYRVMVVRQIPLALTFAASTDVAVTAASFTAANNTIEFALGFAPVTGSSLTVVDNTGAKPIQGMFSNLAQGQVVTLPFNGGRFRFIANYFGGTGNDLTLDWAERKLYTWGTNASRMLGNGSEAATGDPAVVSLSNRIVTAVGKGEEHTVALFANGTVTAWGSNNVGQLANGNFGGRFVTAIAVGRSHNLALCADGALILWGVEINAGGFNARVPQIVSLPGGRTPVAISAGSSHYLILCEDGTLVTFGNNTYGQLGNGTTNSSSTPGLVDQTGALAGKAVVSIHASGTSNLVRCADGTLARWGDTTLFPTAVPLTGALTGKTPAALAHSVGYSLMLCTDGTLGGWGGNASGCLGDGTFTTPASAVSVLRSGVLAGKTIQSIAADGTSYAICTDGTLAVWGGNYYGQLANGTTASSNVPLALKLPPSASGERFIGLAAGGGNGGNATAAITAVPPSNDSSLASLVSSIGSIQPALAPGVADYTLMVPHGSTSLTITPTASHARATLTLNGATLASGTASQPIELDQDGTIIAITVTADDGTTTDYQLTVRKDSQLAGLVVSEGSLTPGFVPRVTAYRVSVSNPTETLAITPIARDSAASITVNGVAVASGSPSPPLALSLGDTPVAVVVTAADGTRTTYDFIVNRPAPLNYVFSSATSVALTVPNYVAAGNAATLGLGFAPTVGSALTVVDNTGTQPISGRFTGLSQGQEIVLEYNNARYKFVANYYGGTGNDLVLVWANTRLYAWGPNASGQLGNGTLVGKLTPTAVTSTGVLAGKTVVAVATGSSHSLALCADGTVASWGVNTYGQLGNGTTTASNLPIAVPAAGHLQGRTVVAIAAGHSHSLALCADGTIAAWGYNGDGHLGDGTTVSRSTPVAVVRTGALAGKTVTAIAAGASSSLACCSDGTVVAWGSNGTGQLGDGTTNRRTAPVLVVNTGSLAGKTPFAVSAGARHSLALCTDGTLVAWGSNTDDSGLLIYGLLGNGNVHTKYSVVPIDITRSGVLAGQKVTAISAGANHSLALLANGTVAAWGADIYGQLGIGGTGTAYAPVAVVTSGVLAGKVMQSVQAGSEGSLVRSGNAGYSWGINVYGQLGNNSTSDSYVPVAVVTSTLASGHRIGALATGSTSSHSLAITGAPLSGVSSLAGLALNPGTLSPTFASGTLNYTVSLPSAATAITITPTAADANTAIQLNGNAVASGSPIPFALGAGPVTLTLKLTSQSGSSSTTYTVRLNRLPTFPGYSIATAHQTPVAVELAKLLAKTSDADGHGLTVTAAGPAAVNGGTAALQAGRILYTPPNNFAGTDTFPVTITDSGGASVIGSVTVTVGLPTNAGGVGTNLPVLTNLPGGKMGIAFQGIPGRRYILQRSVDGLGNWTTLATVTADASGKVSFTDESPPPGSAFYRLGLP